MKAVEYTVSTTYTSQTGALHNFATEVYISRVLDARQNSFEEPSLLGAFNWQSGNIRQLLCTISSKFLPLNLIYEDTQIKAPGFQTYQADIVIMANVFCTNLTSFDDLGVPIANEPQPQPIGETHFPTLDKSQFWMSSSFLPKPSRLEGLLKSKATLEYDLFLSEKMISGSWHRSMYLDLIPGYALGQNFLPNVL